VKIEKMNVSSASTNSGRRRRRIPSIFGGNVKTRYAIVTT
jgi:hypothetical protein